MTKIVAPEATINSVAYPALLGSRNRFWKDGQSRAKVLYQHLVYGVRIE